MSSDPIPEDIRAYVKLNFANERTQPVPQHSDPNKPGYRLPSEGIRDDSRLNGDDLRIIDELANVLPPDQGNQLSGQARMQYRYQFLSNLINPRNDLMQHGTNRLLVAGAVNQILKNDRNFQKYSEGYKTRQGMTPEQRMQAGYGRRRR